MGGAHPSDGLDQGLLGPAHSQPPANFADLASISSGTQGSPRAFPVRLGASLSEVAWGEGYRRLQQGAGSGQVGALKALCSQAEET